VRIMAKTQKITLNDVRESLNPDIVSDVSVRWFGRPLGNLITPFFNNTGWTANGVTIVRFPIALVGVLFLAIPEPNLWQVSALIYYLCFILDFVDGNLARLQNDATYFGKFLDGVADFVYGLLAPFALGMGLWQYFNEPIAIVIGALISLTSATNHMLRSRLSFFREWMVSLTGPLTKSELDSAKLPCRIQAKAAFFIVNAYFFCFLLLFYPVWGGVALLGLLVLFQMIPDIVWMGTTFAEANALLRRGRISRHARVE
jgi:phosphatidylglycerophosphate synthase